MGKKAISDESNFRLFEELLKKGLCSNIPYDNNLKERDATSKIREIRKRVGGTKLLHTQPNFRRRANLNNQITGPLKSSRTSNKFPIN